jgi:mRNA interferase RelE/StbE
MKITIRKNAVRDLQKISVSIKSKIHDKILELEKYPDVANIWKLTNFEPAYRLRIGDYRVLFDVTSDTIEIGRVLHRKESYQK